MLVSFSATQAVHLVSLSSSFFSIRFFGWGAEVFHDGDSEQAGPTCIAAWVLLSVRVRIRISMVGLVLR